ncbi:MAG: HU family DNA-binding protein [Balneolales bacterium]
MDQQISKAIGKVLKDQLLEGNNVKINGLGSFSVVHEKQTQTQDEAGRVMLLPPGDRIKFTPEI